MNLSKNVKINDSYENAIQYALDNYIGNVNYEFGARNPKLGKVDCSGLVSSIIAQAEGIEQKSIDKTSSEWMNYGTEVNNKDDLSRGDLVFFNGCKGEYEVGHVGIYLGKEKFLHSDNSGVTISNLNDRNDYVSARRLSELIK